MIVIDGNAYKADRTVVELIHALRSENERLSALCERHALHLAEIIETRGTLRAEVERLKKALSCADESDCTHMPWCKIRGECQRAALAAEGE